MLKYLSRFLKTFALPEKRKPCIDCISPELAGMKHDLKQINEKIDKMYATVNGDPEWFLKINRGERHGND